MQAEYQTGANVAKKGMIHSFASMSKEEGIRGLYRVLKIIGNWDLNSHEQYSCHPQRSKGDQYFF